MKQLLVIDDPAARDAAVKLVGESCEVLSPDRQAPDLKDRRIIVWPTAPGTGASKEAQKFAKHAAEVKVLITSDKPAGWNAASAVAEGWTLTDFIAWAKPRAVIVTYTEVHVEVNTTDDSPPAHEIQQKIDELGLATIKKTGAPITDMANVVRFLKRDKTHPAIWYDDFYHRVFKFPGEPWNDVDTLRLTERLQDEFAFRKLGREIVDSAVELHAHSNVMNEPRDWLNSLFWDKKPRISDFFVSCLGAEPSAYMSAVGHNFWVGMVARILQPGCQNDHMVVIEGAQNAGKTSLLRIIGGKWYVEATENVQSKDFFMVMNGRMIVEIAELDSFNKAEVTRIKQVVSCPVDSYRLPYARRGADYARTCILVGTTNEDAYLRDSTGARRFWPVKCGKVDLNAARAQRAQLFAEAVVCFRAGDSWHLTPLEETQEAQEQRRDRDIWEDLLKMKISYGIPVTLLEAAELVGITNDKLDMRTQKRLAIALRKLGYERKVSRISGEVKRRWEKIEG